MQPSIQQLVLERLLSLSKLEMKAWVGEEKPWGGFPMRRVKGRVQLQRERNQTHFGRGGGEVEYTFLERGHELMVKILD